MLDRPFIERDLPARAERGGQRSVPFGSLACPCRKCGRRKPRSCSGIRRRRGTPASTIRFSTRRMPKRRSATRGTASTACCGAFSRRRTGVGGRLSGARCRRLAIVQGTRETRSGFPMIVDCHGHCTAEPAALMPQGAARRSGVQPRVWAVRRIPDVGRRDARNARATQVHARMRPDVVLSSSGRHGPSSRRGANGPSLGADRQRHDSQGLRPFVSSPSANCRNASSRGNGSRNSSAASTPRPVSTTNGGAGRSRATRAGRGSGREAGPRCPRA